MKKIINAIKNPKKNNIVGAIKAYHSWRKLSLPYELKLLMTSIKLENLILL